MMAIKRLSLCVLVSFSCVPSLIFAEARLSFRFFPSPIMSRAVDGIPSAAERAPWRVVINCRDSHPLNRLGVR
jgi:hypothetical protein